MISFEKSLEVACTHQELWDWHSREGAFVRLSPPWQKVKLLGFDGIVEGGLAEIQLSLGPFKKKWIARHHDVDPPNLFRDTQDKGPFKSWTHSHRIESAGKDRSRLTDQIDFALPLGGLTEPIGKSIALGQLQALFSYRHKTMESDLRNHGEYDSKPLNILISGASGLLGNQLRAYFGTAGHKIYRLVRREPSNDQEIRWSPKDGVLEFPKDLLIDAVIHLSGANVGKIPWSSSYKEIILDSRIDSTSLLVKSINGLDVKPSVFISASGTGFYGEGGDKVFHVGDSVGNSFLADVCDKWEKASESLDGSIRRITMRLGPVLSSQGGMLQKLTLPAKLGLGTVIGRGQQWVSWIALDDLLAAVEFMIHKDSISGPIHLVNNEPVTMKEFTNTLSRQLKRPRFMWAPESFVKLIGGEAVEAMALTSTKLYPDVLNKEGFRFEYDSLEKTLKHTFGLER